MAPDEYLQPDDLSAKHVQLLVLDLIYLIVAQLNFARTASTLGLRGGGCATPSDPRRDRRPARAPNSNRRPSHSVRTGEEAG